MIMAIILFELNYLWRLYSAEYMMFSIHPSCGYICLTMTGCSLDGWKISLVLIVSLMESRLLIRFYLIQELTMTLYLKFYGKPVISPGCPMTKLPT